LYVTPNNELSIWRTFDKNVISSAQIPFKVLFNNYSERKRGNMKKKSINQSIHSCCERNLFNSQRKFTVKYIKFVCQQQTPPTELSCKSIMQNIEILLISRNIHIKFLESKLNQKKNIYLRRLNLSHWWSSIYPVSNTLSKHITHAL